MICSLTNLRPTFDFRCPNFKSNDNTVKRFIASQQAEKDRLKETSNRWLGLGFGGVFSAFLYTIIKMSFSHIDGYLNVCIVLAAAFLLFAFCLYKFVQLRNECSEIDASIAKYIDENHKNNREDANKNSTSSKDDVITIDRIIRFLKDRGYNPKCERSNDNTTWIDIVHGSEHIYITYRGIVLDVECPFNLGNETDNVAFVHDFLFSANHVMRDKRFLQITLEPGECRFLVSGYVQTFEELCTYLPNYIDIINESIVLHRHCIQRLMQERMEDSKQENSQPTNNDIVS